MNAPPKSNPKPVNLEYDRPGGGPVSRRAFRLLMALTLLNTAMLAVLIVVPYGAPFVKQKWDALQMARAQAKHLRMLVATRQLCLTHAPPASQVAYEEDPEAAAKLLAGAAGAYEPVVDFFGAHAERWNESGPRGTVAASIAPPGYHPPVRAALPAHFREFESNFELGGSERMATRGEDGEPALLFLHERKTPSGKSYLVDVKLYPVHIIGHHINGTGVGSEAVYSMAKVRRIEAQAWQSPPLPAHGKLEHRVTIGLALPDTRIEIGKMPLTRTGPDGEKLVPATQRTAGPIDYGSRLRFFAGQADPKDESHFTIAYVLDGKPGMFDGWVADAGIDLRPREGGPATKEELLESFNNGAHDIIWDPTAPPAKPGE